MVPKKEVWIRKVSETKAYRAGRVPESDGWSARMVPGSEWCQKTSHGNAGRVPESDAWGKGWLPEREILNAGISAGIYLWTDPWI